MTKNRLTDSTLIVLLSLVGLYWGCTSFEDYLYPNPTMDSAPVRLRLPEDGVQLSYLPESGALPLFELHIGGRELRGLLSTRRPRHSISPGVVPEGSAIEGELTLPMYIDGEIVPIVRQVVRVESVRLLDLELQGLLMVVEELPDDIDVVLTPHAFPNAVITLDGPARELRIHSGRLPDRRSKNSKSVSLDLQMLWGSSSVKASRFFASIQVVAASGLDASLVVGPSRSTVIQTHKGPELLPLGPDGLANQLIDSRRVRMDNVFGRDFPKHEASVAKDLGSGWLVLGARFLSTRVLYLDFTNRLARLEG